MSDLHIVHGLPGDAFGSGIICLSEDYQKIIVLVDPVSKEWRLPMSYCYWVQQKDGDPCKNVYLLENHEDTVRRVISEMIGNTVSLNGYAIAALPNGSAKILRSHRIRPVCSSFCRDETLGSLTKGSTEIVQWFWATYHGKFEKFLVNFGKPNQNYLVLETSMKKAPLMLPGYLSDLAATLQKQLPDSPRGLPSGYHAGKETVSGFSVTKRGPINKRTSKGFIELDPVMRLSAEKLSSEKLDLADKFK